MSGILRRLVGAIGVGMALAATAHAEDPAPMLLYGPPGPDPASEALALEVFAQQSLDAKVVPTPRHVETLLGEVPQVEIVGGTVVGCPGSPLAVETFTSGLEEALEHLHYVRVEEANAQLQRLDALLPCLGGVLPRVELARIFFLQGVGLAYLGDDSGARERFRRALVVSPALEWDESFPPSPRVLFEEAFQEALRTPAATLVIEPQLGAAVDLWIDGAAMPEAGGTMTLGQGRHLVQWRESADAYGARMLELEAEASITVLGRADLAAAVLGGAGSELVKERAAGALAPLAAEAGEQVYLAELGPAPLLHSYSFADQGWSISDQGTAARLAANRRRLRNGRLVTYGGAGVAVLGAGLSVVGYTQATRLANEASDITNSTLYNEKYGQYVSYKLMAYMGYGVTGLGAAVAGSGIVMLRRASSGGPSLWATPMLGSTPGLAAGLTGF